ncbi:MAG: SIS domain-containing protein [Ruthenibacterium sp.]
MYTAKKWKETEGACLRNFHEKEDIDSVNGALALRGEIEGILDKIWADGFDGIYFIGIGGTYASSLQVEVYMRGKSSLPVYVENAAEFLTTGNKRFTDKSVVILSSVSGNTKEMVELVDCVHEKGARVQLYRHAGHSAHPTGQAGLSCDVPEKRAAQILHGGKLSDVQKRRICRLRAL